MSPISINRDSKKQNLIRHSTPRDMDHLFMTYRVWMASRQVIQQCHHGRPRALVELGTAQIANRSLHEIRDLYFTGARRNFAQFAEKVLLN